MSTYQNHEAKRLGLTRAIETATDSNWQRKARDIRAENIRRVEAAS